SNHRRLQHHFQLRPASGRSILGAAGPCRQHLHRFHLPGRDDLGRARPDHDQHGFPDLRRSGRQQPSQWHVEHCRVRQRRGDRTGRADRHTPLCLGHLVTVTAVHRERARRSSTVGTISSAGLYTPGSRVGAHSIAATSVADPAQSGSATVAVTDLAGVYTYHNDLSRDGANSQEYALTPADVNTSNFGKLFSCAVDGAIYGQPLWVANLNINGTRHNVVFVATQHDSLYAFDADASPCAQLWAASLIDAGHGAAAGETTVPSGPTGNLVGVGDG